MDVPIKSGTNILIFAYGLEDPNMSDGKATISYHGNRRMTRMIPLQSYGNPPAESKFVGLDYFEFKLDKVQSSILYQHIHSICCLRSSMLYLPMKQPIIAKFTKHRQTFVNVDKPLQ